MNILLLVPPFVEEGLEMASKESIGVCYLAAPLRRAGFKVDILDADLLKLDTEQTVDEICRSSYGLIGFSVLEGTIESTVEIVQMLRSRGVDSHFVLGGFFPTLVVEEVLIELPEVDSLILGEGEQSLLDLAECLLDGNNWRTIPGLAYLHGTQVVQNDQGACLDINKLPFPERDLLPQVLQSGGVAGVVGSRGCFARCSFCCIKQFSLVGGMSAWRGRSPEDIINEIKILVETWGINIVSFYDSNFIGPGRAGVERAWAIGDEFLRSGLNIEFAVSTRSDQIDIDLFRHLKKAGLTEVFIGVESMSQASLDRYVKDITVHENISALQMLDELEIYYRPGFILFEPYISLEQIRENIIGLRELIKSPFCRKYHFFKGLRVYRGSPMESLFTQDEILIRNGWHNSYTWQDPSVARFIQLASAVATKMMPISEKSKELDEFSKNYMDSRLGVWSLDMHEDVLNFVQAGEARQEDYLQIVLRAEKALSRIEQTYYRFRSS